MYEKKTTLSGLKFLITYDKILGNTYWGSCIDGKQTKLSQTIQILWNFILILTVISECYLITDRFMSTYGSGSDTNQLKSSTSLLIYGIYCLGSACYASQTVFNAIFLFLRGKYILDNLIDNHLIRVDERYERRIGLTLIVFKFFDSVLFSFACFHYIFGYEERNQMIFVNKVLYLLLIILSTNTRLHVMTLIAYKCLIVSKQLQSIIDTNQTLNIKSIYLTIHNIYKSIQHFDSLCSINILFTIFFMINILIADLCLIGLGHYDYNNVISVMISLSALLTLCVILNILPQSYRKFLDSLEIIYCKTNSVQTNDEILLLKIENFSHKISLTAMNLFNVNINTFLSCLSLIITYSVILIQTTQPSK